MRAIRSRHAGQTGPSRQGLAGARLGIDLAVSRAGGVLRNEAIGGSGIRCRSASSGRGRVGVAPPNRADAPWTRWRSAFLSGPAFFGTPTWPDTADPTGRRAKSTDRPLRLGRGGAPWTRFREAVLLPDGRGWLSLLPTGLRPWQQILSRIWHFSMGRGCATSGRAQGKAAGCGSGQEWGAWAVRWIRAGFRVGGDRCRSDGGLLG